MLSFYHRLASRLLPLRRLLWAGVVACLAAFMALVWQAGAPRGNALALAAVSLMLWLLLLIAIAHGFGRSEASSVPDSLHARLRWQARRAVAWLAALAMTGLTGFVLLFSLRALAAMLRGST